MKIVNELLLQCFYRIPIVFAQYCHPKNLTLGLFIHNSNNIVLDRDCLKSEFKMRLLNLYSKN